MKVIKESDFSPQNLLKHVDEHGAQYIKDSRFKDVLNDAEAFNKRYNQIANELSHKHVGKSNSKDNYIGYIDKNNNVVKYDTKKHDFVVYDKKWSITMHKKSRENYDKIRKRDFKKELPYNEEK